MARAMPDAMARRWRAACLLLATAVVLLAPGASAAEVRPGRIMLLQPLGASTVARSAMTRIREELVAGGFEVSGVDPGPQRDPVSLAAVMERQEGALAVIALVGAPEQPGAELWILDRVGTSPEARRIPLPTGDNDQLPEVLAIRTIEVLKASALKRLLESKVPPAPPAALVAAPPAVVAPAAARAAAASDVAAHRWGFPFGLETGISVLESRGGPGAAALPVVRARARLYEALSARLTLAGLGTRPRVESSIGSSSVAESLGLLELLLALRFAPRWRLGFSLGGGALHLRSEGEGVWPYRGLRESRLVGAFDAGAGVLADIGGQVSLAFEIHGLVSVPHPTLRFYDAETATVGYPAVLGSLTMVAWL